METYVLILFGFGIVLTMALGLDASASKHDIQTLKARLDRRDALEAKPNVKAIPETPTRLSNLYARIFTLEHTIALKNEAIKNLNGDIAKLKFDYACQVAGCKCHKTETPAPLRGEWVAEEANEQGTHVGFCKCCAGSGKNRLGEMCETCEGSGFEKERNSDLDDLADNIIKKF